MAGVIHGDGFDYPEYLAYVESPLTGTPELLVEQPAGVGRASGATVDFGPLALGTAATLGSRGGAEHGHGAVGERQ